MLFYKLGITEINYYLALIIVLMTSKVGALFPDLDHDWHNIGNKTVPNKIINVLIHATGGKHRSWQTHSIDICAWFTVAAFTLPGYLTNEGIISQVNREVLSILWLGFASGWISHLFSDMLTSAGVRLFCFINKKIKLVPKKIGNLSFNTGHEWEAFNYKVIKILNIFLGIICLAYPLIIESGILN
jgi:membrane-bound metal-dependent hydrolase YbcI (DUF457 family)